MFGWFDRKHLGWLSRFMQRVPIFPIPSGGRFTRQPLYVGDFCNVIISCIENQIGDGVFNISGLEKIYYIDIIKSIKVATHARSVIVKVPYALFYALLWAWGKFDNNPPFTTQQLSSLVINEEFEIIDWPGTFKIVPTTFAAALEETFNDPRFSAVVLDF